MCSGVGTIYVLSGDKAWGEISNRYIQITFIGGFRYGSDVIVDESVGGVSA